MSAVAVQGFGFGAQLVRVIERGGTAWFVIAGNKERLSEQEGFAFDELARIAQRVEAEINSIADPLGAAMDGNEAPAL